MKVRKSPPIVDQLQTLRTAGLNEGTEVDTDSQNKDESGLIGDAPVQGAGVTPDEQRQVKATVDQSDADNAGMFSE